LSGGVWLLLQTCHGQTNPFCPLQGLWFLLHHRDYAAPYGTDGIDQGDHHPLIEKTLFFLACNLNAVFVSKVFWIYLITTGD